MFLCLGFVFMFSIQAVPCAASFACPDGSSISCKGDSTCHGGIMSIVQTMMVRTHLRIVECVLC